MNVASLFSASTEDKVMSRYSLNPELKVKLTKEYNRIGLSKEIQDSLFSLMDIAAIAIIEKESRRIVRCLVEEGLSPEKIKRITGCDVEELYPSIAIH